MKTRIRVSKNNMDKWNGKGFSKVKGGVLLIDFQFKKNIKAIGAGYIGGRTLFIARNSGSLKYARNFRNGKIGIPAMLNEYLRIGNIEFGFTQNANLVPYANQY